MSLRGCLLNDHRAPRRQPADSGSPAARQRGWRTGWEASTARSPPLLSSAGARSPLGLIKPKDPLLLIDFLIINSVCPSISLRRRISPHHAEVLCAICGHRGTDEQISTTVIKNLTARVNLAVNCCVTGHIMHTLRHRLPINAPACTPTCA